MTTEELIKANAILIHEQREEIVKLRSIIEDTLNGLDEYFLLEHTAENLPELVKLWVKKAKKHEKNFKDYFEERRTLELKYR